MRDRLGDLLAVAKDSGEDEFEFEFNGGVNGGKELDPLGAAFDEGRAMDGVFQEVQSVRQEIALLRMDVKRLGTQNTRFLTSVRRISAIKRDANSIARNIRARGESVYARLRALEARRRGLEERRGADSALARIARSQHAAAARAFRDAMAEYGRAEADQREHCKARIRRQAAIAGRPLTGEQLEEMIETGRWDVLDGGGVVTEGRGLRAALAEIGRRRRELLDLEARVREVHGLFLQMALLVEEQSCALESIEANVCSTQNHVGRARACVKRAVQCKRRNPCRRLFCCCLNR
ncbi:syntaxin-11-like [Anguilla anguilla]|uniref:syntaxin-11-like n=1 Tax=Anguilla anguilla TaxID=7936 RepID=UPI0015AF2D83|nr:syntaxin-11-like [Anguilla anguilla]XP_035279324.1 syntaxin-11-like [Anguilla anguilla]XP_035279325.1 syntaxin-11-like [Anguilla anguilla]